MLEILTAIDDTSNNQKETKFMNELMGPLLTETLCTCSRQVNAASRNFFTFLVQEEDTRFTMALGKAGSEEEINLWQAVEIAPSASNMVSFPCQSKDKTNKGNQSLSLLAQIFTIILLKYQNTLHAMFVKVKYMQRLQSFIK